MIGYSKIGVQNNPCIVQAYEKCSIGRLHSSIFEYAFLSIIRVGSVSLEMFMGFS